MAEESSVKTCEQALSSTIGDVALFAEKFDERMRMGSGRAAIFMHPGPDPDSMACAAGMQWLLKTKYGMDANIFCDGEISHPQNKTFVNVLQLTMHLMDEYSPDDYETVIVVDATATSRNLPVVPDVVIDHHRSVEQTENCLSLINPVGAAATLVWELIDNLLCQDGQVDVDQNVATALCCGIRNDTGELTTDNVSDRDWTACRQLTDWADRKKLASIFAYTLPPYFFELERVINDEGNFCQKNSVFVGAVGVIAPAKRDAMPELATKMLRMEGVETVVVFGIVGDNLDASVRSKNSSVDVDSFVKRVFGRENGGGKHGAGGAKVPLSVGSPPGWPKEWPEECRSRLWQAIRDGFFHRIMEVASGN